MAGIVLRDYQEDAVSQVNEQLKQHRSVLLVLATGSGKTPCSGELAKQRFDRGETVLFIAHRQELISQASLTFGVMGIPHKLICPKPLQSKIKMLHFSELGKSYIDPFSSVTIASAQTLRGKLDQLPNIDLLLVDEAAHAPSPLWRNIIEHCNTYTAGVTATPTRSDRQSLGEVFNHMHVGKDMKSLIADGNLCPYDIYSTPEEFDLSEVKRIKSGENKGDYNRGDLEKQIDKPKIVGRAVEHYEKYAKGKSAMVFAVSVKHSEHIAKEFCDHGYKFVSIDGTTEDAVRYKAFQDLKKKLIDGIVNVDIAGEGVSVDGVKVVIMLRPISELAFGLYAQQIGRALRLAPGKDRGIIIDMVGNARRHGFVEDHTDWTLWEGEEKKKKKKDEEATEKVKACPDCFTVHPNKKFCTSCRMDHNPDGCSIEDPNKISLCPSCGYVYPVMVREYEEVEGELVELERQQQQEQARKDYNAQLRAAETPADLLAVDKAMGHKPGAASHKQKAIEEKRAAMANLNKAVRYYKEQIAWGDPDLFNDIMLGAFSMSEKDTRARGFGVKKIEALVEDMRDFAQLRNECIEQPYSGINFRMAIRGRQLGL